MLASEKTKIEITNVEDIKDIANDFDILNHNEILMQKREKEKQYELNKHLIRQDLEILKNEIMDRENLHKLREILEFIEKADPTFALDVDRTLYRDVIIEIFNNFLEDITNPTNSLIDYNLIRDSLKFIAFMEESRSYKKFFEIYDTQKNLKNKLKEHENSLIGKLNHIVKVKQKKRRQEIQKKKKYLTEEISKEFSRRNLPKINDLLEEDFCGKKEELFFRNNNNFDIIGQNDNNSKRSIEIKQEIKQEAISSLKNKIKKENNEDFRSIDIENQTVWNTITENGNEQFVLDSEEEKNQNMGSNETVLN